MATLALARRVLAATTGVLALVAGATASAPPAAFAAACVGPAAENATPLAIADAATSESTITVAGAQSYLADVDVITQLAHTFAADLDVTLVSPAGTAVTLTTDNGAGNDDVFKGTRWDDSADAAASVNAARVTDHTYTNLELASPLSPEEPLSALVGEDPNGVWTLRIVDDLATDAGTLESWSLDLRTVATPPPASTLTFSNPTVVPIPDVAPAGASSTIDVTGAGPSLADLDLDTILPHTFAADLDVTLTSPAGTAVTLTTDNGAGNDDVFKGTRWDDSADATTPVNAARVTDHTYTNAVLASPLSPEEPLAAFAGENPNGTWTLTAVDDLAGDFGSITSWSLILGTRASGPDCPPPAAPKLSPPPLAAPTLTSLSLSPKRFRAASKGASATAKRKRKPTPVGSAVAYQLDSTATVTFTVERARPGRRVSGRCVKPNRSNRKKPRCTRYHAVKGSFTDAGVAGPNGFKFSGRLGGRKLGPGKYRLVGMATSPGGSSRVARAAFSIAAR